MFTHTTTMQELKAAYREAARAHHPDLGGSEEEMRLVNLAYEEAKKRIEEGGTAHTDDGFRDILNKLISLAGLEIEVCGHWIWVGGDTKPHKDTLKEAGCRWSANKGMWYWRPAWCSGRRSRREHTIDDIRGYFGSQQIRERHRSIGEAV